MAEHTWGRLTARVLSRVAAVVTGVALLAVPGLAQADTGHWRIVATTGPAVLQDVEVSGPQDAWAVGFRCPGTGACEGSRLVVRHWNGQAWRAVPAPRGAPAKSVRATISGSSARNAWVVASDLRSAKAFHWNGRRWTGMPLPGASAINSVDALSSHDAWAFGFAGQKGYVARFDGRTWRRVDAPAAVYYQQAVSATDIWAVGPSKATQTRSSARQVYVAMRWNGRRWRTLTLPSLAKGRPLAVYGLAATGRRNLWLDYSTGTGNHQGAALLHWNGRWHMIAVPYSGQTYAVQRLTPDGRGGLWLAALGGAPSFPQFLYHYRDGHWSRQLAPARPRETTSVQDAAWTPGTTSVWAVGMTTVRSGRHSAARGVFLRFGG